MISVKLLFVNLIFIRSDEPILEEGTNDIDNPKLFQGYLLKKIREQVPNIVQNWVGLKKKFGLTFKLNENKLRFFTYAKNSIFIKEFMKDNSSNFEVAENDLIYLTREEYFDMLGSYIPDDNNTNGEVITIQEIDRRQNVPKTIDWRTKNVVTPVKNQLKCGGCYAFTAASTVESAIAIKTGNLMDLSEQEIIDCSGKFGNLGCNGGALVYTYKYFMQESVAQEKSYPYKGYVGQCRNAPDFAMKIKSYKSIRSGDESGLASALLSVGPVGVSIDAKPSSFRFYKSGIYSDPSCSKSTLNHGVTVVGVMDQFYIVKNSWSPNWGMKGYIQIARNAGNICGIASAAAYPIL